MSRPALVNAADEELAIVCPHDDEVCEIEACYDSGICAECGERVAPEKRRAA